MVAGPEALTAERGEVMMPGARPTAKATRWLARIWSAGSLLLVLAILIGEGAIDPHGIRLTAAEAIALAFFPVGVCAGLVLAWMREGLGGVVAVGSLGAFYLAHFVLQGRLPSGPWFLLISLPGFLFLIAWRLCPGRPAPATDLS